MDIQTETWRVERRRRSLFPAGLFLSGRSRAVVQIRQLSNVKEPGRTKSAGANRRRPGGWSGGGGASPLQLRPAAPGRAKPPVGLTVFFQVDALVSRYSSPRLSSFPNGKAAGTILEMPRPPRRFARLTSPVHWKPGLGGGGARGRGGKQLIWICRPRPGG